MLGGLGGSVRLEKDGEGPVFWWLSFDRRRRRFDKGGGDIPSDSRDPEL